MDFIGNPAIVVSVVLFIAPTSLYYRQLATSSLISESDTPNGLQKCKSERLKWVPVALTPELYSTGLISQYI